MGSPAVKRRLVIAGGLCAGGGLLFAAAERRAHTSAAPSPGPASAPSTTRPAAPHPTPTPTAAVARTPEQLTAKLDAYRRSRDGTFSVALHDRRNGATFRYRSDWHNETLSTLKVLIVATVLHHCEELRISLTRSRAANVRAAITKSDNDAAEDLLAWVGRAECNASPASTG